MSDPELREAPAVEAPAPPADVPPGMRVRAVVRLAVAGALLLAMGAALVVRLANARFEPLEVVAVSGAEPSVREAKLRRELDRLAPSGTFAVVDTFQNRFRFYRGEEMLRVAVCSTGSGLVLRDQQGDREWVFDTPRGERRVERKTRDPVWVKPDWAFIEEGYLPPESFAERRDDVSLGDYGLYLGHGYLIHGTLFKSLLGRKITHGCIRLGDEDLEFAFHNLAVGARVFLY